jgi:hypothetical protein
MITAFQYQPARRALQAGLICVALLTGCAPDARLARSLIARSLDESSPTEKIEIIVGQDEAVIVDSPRTIAAVRDELLTTRYRAASRFQKRRSVGILRFYEGGQVQLQLNCYKDSVFEVGELTFSIPPSGESAIRQMINEAQQGAMKMK